MPFISSIRSVYGPIGKFSRRILSKDAITGGIISSAGGYRIHTFNDVGTNYFNMSMLASAMNVEYLIIAGGGSGGARGSGGGAGGHRTGTISSSPANYPVVVGFGGYSYHAESGGWSNGGNSSFNGVVSTGGGIGGATGSANGQGSPADILPQAGGSGGGGVPLGNGSYSSPGAGTSGQGYAGGNGLQTYGTPVGTTWNPQWNINGGGGGGGAGGVGGNAYYVGGFIANGGGGSGGAGMSSSITGASVTRASGGGGSGVQVNITSQYHQGIQTATPGGGGRGWSTNFYSDGPLPSQNGGSSYPGQPGASNTGGGGGGDYSNGPQVGGSGVVILRYPYP